MGVGWGGVGWGWVGAALMSFAAMLSWRWWRDCSAALLPGALEPALNLQRLRDLDANELRRVSVNATYLERTAASTSSECRQRYTLQRALQKDHASTWPATLSISVFLPYCTALFNVLLTCK